MFKSKGILYILFPVVLLIWGTVIYKMLGGIGNKAEEKYVLPKAGMKMITRIEKDTFSLLPLDRDPFLGHYYGNPNPVVNRTFVPKPKIAWPKIVYLGLVSDTGQSSKIHVLEIAGNQFLLEEGNKIEGVKLIGAGTDKVILNYKGERKVFSKNN